MFVLFHDHPRGRTWSRFLMSIPGGPTSQHAPRPNLVDNTSDPPPNHSPRSGWIQGTTDQLHVPSRTTPQTHHQFIPLTLGGSKGQLTNYMYPSRTTPQTHHQFVPLALGGSKGQLTNYMRPAKTGRERERERS